jgi:hypothetical protein
MYVLEEFFEIEVTRFVVDAKLWNEFKVRKITQMTLADKN